MSDDADEEETRGVAGNEAVSDDDARGVEDIVSEDTRGVDEAVVDS